MTKEEALMTIQAIPEVIWEKLSDAENEAVEMAVNALKGQMWVPCSERLPECDGYNKALDELLQKTEAELYRMILQSSSKLDFVVGLSVAIHVIEKIIDEMRRKDKMDSRIEKQELTESYREKMKGKKYRHFKGGLYEIIDIAIHSENVEQMVVYKSCNNPSLVWARPLNMFMSEVDRDKYPNAKQKMRFELVE